MATKKSAAVTGIRAGVATGRAAATATAAVAVGTTWFVRKTWLRGLIAYLAAITWVSAALAALAGAGWVMVATCGACVTVLAAGWRVAPHPTRGSQHTGWVRGYRAAIAGTYTAWATVADPLHRGPAIPVLVVVSIALTWPWVYHLRSRNQVEPIDVDTTEEWAERWKTSVIDHGVCVKTRLTYATRIRDGVIEASIKLLPGSKIGEIAKTGPLVETALELPEGAVGYRRTGKAAKLKLVIVSKSYIADAVTYPGPTYRNGRFNIVTYADGTPGEWIHLQAKSGAFNGLVVGSTNAGKSRALGVIIDNLLSAGVDVAIGDPQGGQSLPAWRHAVGEYHDSPEAVGDIIRRLHAEVMTRSKALAKAGVSAFDVNDPRVQALGLKPLAVLIDECQLVLTSKTPEGRQLTALAEEIAATSRKTGDSLILATQLPQMASLGGSIRLRDALVAGNCLILRLSNRGSGTTILPDDFVGDPFAIPAEENKKTTAGTGYLRAADLMGMRARVPLLDEDAAAARHTRRAITWLAPEPQRTHGNQVAQPQTRVQQSDVWAAANNLREKFGLPTSRTSTAVLERPDAQSVNTKQWIIATLRSAPQSAQALLSRPDCPAKKTQLYASLDELAGASKLNRPTSNGGPWTVTEGHSNG